jgi:hypothetical protein
MEVLERYLQAVKPLLPRDQREDIFAELESDLRSQFEERASELGRSLTEAEQEELLKEVGHPLILAGRYQPNRGTLTFGRELIGAELFPFYQRVLTLLMGITGLFHIALLIVIGALGNPDPNPIGGLIVHLGVQFAIVTGLFAFIQHDLVKNPERYALHGKTPPRQPDSIRKARFEAVMQLIVLLAVFPWVHSVLWPTYVAFPPGRLGPIWHSSYGFVLALFLVDIAQSVFSIFRPDAARIRATVRLTLTASWIVLLGFILGAGNWVVLPHQSVTVRKAAEISSINHYVFYYGLIGTIVGASIQLLFDIAKLVRVSKQESVRLSGAR